MASQKACAAVALFKLRVDSLACKLSPRKQPTLSLNKATTDLNTFVLRSIEVTGTALSRSSFAEQAFDRKKSY